jgi:small-conductance mechanosensitive channel
MQVPEFWERISAHLPQVIAALPVALAIIIGTIVLNLILGRALLLLAHRTHLTEADVLPIRHILRWLLRIIASILILSVLGFKLGGIWAVISTVMGLVAIGFVAVWSLLSNTSSTVLILFLRPFQIGDDIEFPGEPVRGRVVDLNFFFTTLIDHEGTLLQIPNNLFFQKTVKRRRNQPPVALAIQLNSPIHAQVELPSPPPPATGAEAKPRQPDPLMSIPDPRTLHPPRK